MTGPEKRRETEKDILAYIDESGSYEFRVLKLASIFKRNKNYAMEADKIPLRNMKVSDLLVRRLFSYSSPSDLDILIELPDAHHYLVIMEALSMLKQEYKQSEYAHSESALVSEHDTLDYFANALNKKIPPSDDRHKEAFLKKAVNYLHLLYESSRNTFKEIAFQPHVIETHLIKPDFIDPLHEDYDFSDLICAEAYAPNFYRFEKRLAYSGTPDHLKLLDFAIKTADMISSHQLKSETVELINFPSMSLSEIVRVCVNNVIIDTLKGDEL
jgi:hypothetical protein